MVVFAIAIAIAIAIAVAIAIAITIIPTKMGNNDEGKAKVGCH